MNRTVSRTSLDRFTARARARRRMQLRAVQYGGLALVLALGLGWLVGFSPLLTVRQVQVTGEERVAAQEVLDAAGVPLGVPLSRLDMDGIRGRVEAIRAVAAADVQRRPPYTVRISVTERLATAVVRTPSGYELVDDRGVRFAPVAQPPDDLPMLATRVAQPSPYVLERATAVLRALPAAVRGRVASVNADSPYDVSLRLDRGVQVVWGGPEESEHKAAVLAALMRRPAKVYDVSVPTAPVTRGSR